VHTQKRGMFLCLHKFENIEWSFNEIYGAGTEFASESFDSVKCNLLRMYNFYEYAHITYTNNRF